MKHGDWRMASLVAVLAAAGTFVAGAPGADGDWPQYRGPNRDGISTETAWLSEWPVGGPKRLWSASLGVGYSAVSVRSGRAYTMGNKDDQDIVYCFEAVTGRELWKHSYPCRQGEHKGPRSTPAVDDKAVYTLSRQGHLFALDAQSGKVLWRKDVGGEYGIRPPGWGIACSPLLAGKAIVLDVGVICAVDKATGRTIWRTRDFGVAYSSPVAMTSGRENYIAAFPRSGLVVVGASNGRGASSYAWDTGSGVNAATPIVTGDSIFISSSYGKGCALIRVVGRTTPVWRNTNMKNHFSTCVLVGEHLYGFDDSTLACIDLKTGERPWTQGGLGKGSLMAADGKLIVLSERGELSVAKASPRGFEPTARTRAVNGHCWTVPVLADGLIYCRADDGSLVCLDVRDPNAIAKREPKPAPPEPGPGEEPKPKPKPKPKEPRDDEAVARSQFKLARMYLLARRVATAKEHLRNIIEKYPDTQAAAEARTMLKSLE